MRFPYPIIKWQSNWPTSLKKFYIDYVPRHKNMYTDALASHTATLVLSFELSKCIIIRGHDFLCPKRVLEVDEMLQAGLSLEPRSWRFSFIDYVLYAILLKDPKETISVKKKATKTYYDVVLEALYHKSYDDILLH